MHFLYECIQIEIDNYKKVKRKVIREEVMHRCLTYKHDSIQ